MSFFSIKKFGRTLVKMTALLTLLVGVSVAGVKYVAVVETDIDAQSGASEGINPAEVREITAELRRQASQNLPLSKYSVMTAETIQSMGGAVLEECAEENCVIALGNKIGADYIVRGTISKFQTKFTLAVELYETENGTLIVSSDAVRSENLGELLDKAAEASAKMYKIFVDGQKTAQPAPESAAGETAPSVNLSGGGESGERELKTYSYSVLKYKFPIKTSVGWGGVDVEYGKIRNDGYFTAFDFGWAIGSKDDDLAIDALGFGKTYGYALDLPEDLRLIVGGSVGLWFSGSGTNLDDASKGISGSVSTTIYDFFGPTVKIQWKFAELSYRWLMGYYTTSGDISVTAGSGSYKTTTSNKIDDNGFSYKHHQLALGFCAREELTKSWDYGKYSFADRFGAAAMNWAVPGLGSMVVMHDYLWGIPTLAFVLSGITFNILAGSDFESERHYREIGDLRKQHNINEGYEYWTKEQIDECYKEADEYRKSGATFAGIGTTALVVGLLANAAHPWIAGLKSPAKTASRPADGFKFAAYPKDGDLQYVGAYTKSF